MYPYKQGDASPPFVCFLQTEAGYSLSGKTVALVLEKPDGSTASKSVTVLDAATRKVQVDWSSGDFDQVGTYRAEFVITSAGKDRTIPADSYVNFRVTAEL
jgi:hypothetical protein